jgi:hypothetical protein
MRLGRIPEYRLNSASVAYESIIRPSHLGFAVVSLEPVKAGEHGLEYLPQHAPHDTAMESRGLSALGSLS